jgi:hypothetical protein
VRLSIITPWRSGDPIRERNWSWCKARWQALFPDAELIEADHDGEPFCRGRAINAGVARSSGDVLVLADADGADEREAINESVDLALGGRWVVCYSAPHGYQALTEIATLRLLECDPASPLPAFGDREIAEKCWSYSGSVCLTRAMFDEVGGYDERMISWGYEDSAFQACADTLIGPHARAGATHYHLWHEHREGERFQQPFIGHNRALSDAYAACRDNPEAMRALIAARSSTVV